MCKKTRVRCSLFCIRLVKEINAVELLQHRTRLTYNSCRPLLPDEEIVDKMPERTMNANWTNSIIVVRKERREECDLRFEPFVVCQFAFIVRFVRFEMGEKWDTFVAGIKSYQIENCSIWRCFRFMKIAKIEQLSLRILRYKNKNDIAAQELAKTSIRYINFPLVGGSAYDQLKINSIVY
jgi:hypothetical protein